jgi:hypothetical protein
MVEASLLPAPQKYKWQSHFHQSAVSDTVQRQSSPKLLSEPSAMDYSTCRDLARILSRVPIRFLKARRMNKSSTRRYARYRTELPVIVKVLGKDGYVRVHGRCFEIAEAGLGAVITSELAAGEMVTLEFSIPEISEAFVMRAVVRHRMGFLHGFEFIGALPDQSELIQTFCRKLEPS